MTAYKKSGQSFGTSSFYLDVREVIKSKAMLELELPYCFRRSLDGNLMCIKFTQKAQRVLVKRIGLFFMAWGFVKQYNIFHSIKLT
jgi:hypothetical protein